MGDDTIPLGLLSWIGTILELVSSNKFLSWEELSFKFDIGLIRLCDNYPGSRNLRDKDGVLLKLTWVVDKQLDRMGVVGLGLLTWLQINIIVKFTISFKAITKGFPDKQIQPISCYKFFLAIVLTMGGLVRMDGLVPNNFCILKFCWHFGTFCINASKYVGFE